MHSDRGVQYAADEHRRLIAQYKMVQSMSRKGWDNAPMESFFKTLKVEWVDRAGVRQEAGATCSRFRASSAGIGRAGVTRCVSHATSALARNSGPKPPAQVPPSAGVVAVQFFSSTALARRA